MMDVSNDIIYRNALYTGSFDVRDSEHNARMLTVRKELEARREITVSKAVTICISIRGVKICSADRTIVFMAHALRRISYTTCDYVHKQFIFLAREPSGDANHQFGHVFVTQTVTQAEELNRILSDAFQLAYVRQNIAKLRTIDPNYGYSQERLSTPRLCDQYPRWLLNEDGPTSVARPPQPTLDVPPPPSYPPPPLPVSTSTTTTPVTRSAFLPSSVMHAVDLAQPGSPKDLEANRRNNQQSPEFSFRRRVFFRPNQQNRHSVIADTDLVGGSIRQPQRRQGLGWASLFASARHSAIFTGSKNNDTPDFFGQRKSPQQKQPLFFDLRTFTGGSPVVALKERLDAQAVEEAKAEAFAEAAAVLAAVRQASVESGGSQGRSPRSSKSSGSPVVSSASPCSTTSTHSEPNRPMHYDESEADVNEAPLPPIRTHSLRREHICDNRHHLDSVPVTSHHIDVGANSCHEHGMVKAPDGHRHPRGTPPNTAMDRYGFRQSANQAGPGAMRLTNHPSSPSIVPVGDTRTRRSVPNSNSDVVFINPIKIQDSSGTTQTRMAPHHSPPYTNNKANHSKPVHFDHDPCGLNGVMSISTTSTETPTPTATPTPTPTQTPQPVATTEGTFTSSDEWNYLKEAPWYQAFIPREVALELLAHQEIGSFLVRNSASHPECCALSVRVPISENLTGITHYLIQRTPRGVRLKGLDKVWPTIKSLITHLSVIPEVLPCTLRLQTNSSNPTFTQVDARSKTHGISDQTQEPFTTTLSAQSVLATSGQQSVVENGHISDPIGKQSVPTYSVANLLPNNPSLDPNQRITDLDIVDRDEEDDEDYQRLSDFSSILGEVRSSTEHPQQSIPSC